MTCLTTLSVDEDRRIAFFIPILTLLLVRIWPLYSLHVDFMTLRTLRSYSTDQEPPLSESIICGYSLFSPANYF
jgi:hypothetical protein